jgi:hypothetical protein
MQLASLSQVLNTTTTVPSIPSLCKKWGELRNISLPGICHQLMIHDEGLLQKIIHHHRDSLEGEIMRHGFSSSRNISIGAVLAGILFILFIIAAVLRYRQSKLAQVMHMRSGRNSVTWQYLQIHSRHRGCSLYHIPGQSLLSTIVMHYPADIPPDYQTIMMVEEKVKELPSYDEASWTVASDTQEGSDDKQDDSDV